MERDFFVYSHTLVLGRFSFRKMRAAPRHVDSNYQGQYCMEAWILQMLGHSPERNEMSIGNLDVPTGHEQGTRQRKRGA